MEHHFEQVDIDQYVTADHRERYEQLSQVEQAVYAVHRQAMELCEMELPSEDAAEVMAAEFHKSARERLEATEYLTTVIQVAGEGLRLPQIRLEMEPSEDGQVVTMSANTEQPYRSAELFEETNMTPFAIACVIESLATESGDSKYRVSAEMAGRDIRKSKHFVAGPDSGLPLGSVELQSIVRASLDNRTQFSIPELDALRQRRESLGNLAVRYANDEPLVMFANLEAELESADDSRFRELPDDILGQIKTLASDEGEHSELADTLTRYLSELPVHIKGRLLVDLGHDGKPAAKGVDDMLAKVTGVTRGNPYSDTDELHLVLSTMSPEGETLRYMPLSQVESIKY